MDPSPNREVALFTMALQMDASQRAVYLDKVCANEPALRRHLEALLLVHQKAITFLESPAAAAPRCETETSSAGEIEK